MVPNLVRSIAQQLQSGLGARQFHHTRMKKAAPALTPAIFALPLLLLATPAGAQASVAPETTPAVEAGAAGVAARVEPLPHPPPRDHAIPQPPAIIDLGCPLKTGFTQVIDVSTGAVDWRLQGAGLAPYPKPLPLKPESVPPAWNVALADALWVQALPDLDRRLESGPYIFKTQFRILKSPDLKRSNEMRVTLKGRVLADEKFTVELFEPNPANAAADHPSQWGANADPPDPAQLKPQDIFDVDLLVGEAVFQRKPSGSKNPRAGVYDLIVTVENGVGDAQAVAMIAQLELTQTCLKWGNGTKLPKTRARKKTRRR
jgi:hypothetical protein